MTLASMPCSPLHSCCPCGPTAGKPWHGQYQFTLDGTKGEIYAGAAPRHGVFSGCAARAWRGVQGLALHSLGGRERPTGGPFLPLRRRGFGSAMDPLQCKHSLSHVHAALLTCIKHAALRSAPYEVVQAHSGAQS